MNPRDEEPDAWLAQALRHAPDAHADAPPALSDLILREARAAAVQSVAPAAPPRSGESGLLRWLASASDWLARPPVAAGFASVMVVTLVGVMWWGQPLDQSLPRAPEAVSSTPQARTEAAPEVQPTPAETVAPKPAHAPARQRRPADAAPAMAAAETSGAGAADTADTAASPRSDVRALQGSASPALAKARAADAVDAPLATLRARIAQQPERWRWQRGPGAPQPMNAAVQGWLAELDARSAARWQASADSLARAPAGRLRLFRDGALQATLGFTGSAVWIETSGALAPAASVATLPEAAAESLRKALDDATP